jgi:succinyl-diaminopimelate desuccinylase
MAETDPIFRTIEGSKETMISFLSEIISIPAIGPLSGGTGEGKKAEYLTEKLRGWGFDDIIHHDAIDENVPSGRRPNIEIRMKGRNRSKRFVIITHLDVVPPGDIVLWSGDPFRLRREGEKLVGRGVEDNGQAMTASIFALKTLKDLGIEPSHDVSLFMVSDEEETNIKGIGHLLDLGLIDEKDLILVPDHGDPEGRVIELIEKTLLWMKITVKGKQCHASMPGLGNNALRASMLFGTEVDRILHERFDRSDPSFDHPVSSFEPTKKGPGVEGINVLPGEDTFYMDCRLIPPYTTEEVLSVMREVADGIEKKTGTEITIKKEFSETTLHPTSPDSEIVRSLSSAIVKVTKKEPVTGGIGGGTCAALLRDQGFDVAVWETIHNRAHSNDEYILVDNLMKDTKVFAALFLG